MAVSGFLQPIFNPKVVIYSNCFDAEMIASALPFSIDVLHLYW